MWWNGMGIIIPERHEFILVGKHLYLGKEWELSELTVVVILNVSRKYPTSCMVWLMLHNSWLMYDFDYYSMKHKVLQKLPFQPELGPINTTFSESDFLRIWKDESLLRQHLPALMMRAMHSVLEDLGSNGKPLTRQNGLGDDCRHSSN